MPIQKSLWPFLASIIVTTFFFTCIVLLEYIKIDIVGIYAIFIAGSSVLFGVYSYAQYLFFLWFIYKAGKCEVIDYDQYTPADTKWITNMAMISQRLRNYFLFIGLIYVIEYAILVPANQITITTTISINMPNNFAFIISWIAVFLLVVVAFPIINRVQFQLISKIVSNLKGRSIKNLSELMFLEKERADEKSTSFTTIIAYNILVDTIRKSKDYPLKRQLSYETIMLMVTFVVHIFNLYNKVASLPFISLPLL